MYAGLRVLGAEPQVAPKSSASLQQSREMCGDVVIVVTWSSCGVPVILVGDICHFRASLGLSPIEIPLLTNRQH